MSEIKIPVKRSLEQRLKEAIKSSDVSMLPEDHQRKKKEETPPPDLREVVESAAARLKIARWVADISELNRAISDFKKQRDPLVLAMKEYLNSTGIKADRFMVGDIPVNHFSSPRTKINVQKLMEKGVLPNLIASCTDTKDVDVLKVGAAMEGEDEEI